MSIRIFMAMTKVGTIIKQVQTDFSESTLNVLQVQNFLLEKRRKFNDEKLE